MTFGGLEVMWKTINAYRILVSRREETTWDISLRWYDNIKEDPKEITCKSVYWIHLVQGMEK
jgi:hypothetical protein